MSWKIQPTKAFKKKAKILLKKYRNIGQDLSGLQEELLSNPKSGNAIPNFENKVWKVRMGSVDMKVGKSGGFRIYYHLDEEDKTISLLYIHTKEEMESIPINQLKDMVESFASWLDERRESEEEVSPESPSDNPSSEPE